MQLARIRFLVIYLLFNAAAAATELYNNGTFVTGTNVNGDTISEAPAYGTGPGGAANSVAGFSFDKDEQLAIADDFTVPASQTWDVQTLKAYAYQTLPAGNTSTAPTLTAAFVRIYSGDPRSGGVLVAGDTTTNRLVSGTFSNVYRVFNGSSTPSFLTNKQRPIMEYIVDLSWVPDLPTGSYFVAVCTTGSISSGPWWVPRSELDGSNAAIEDVSWQSLVEEQLINGASQNPPIDRPRDVMFKIDGNSVTSAQTILPSNAVIGPGSVISGGLASLFSSDDDKYVARPGSVALSSQRPCVVVLEGTAPAATASLLQFVLESSSNLGNLNEIVEVFNFTSGVYDAPASNLTLTATDTSKTITIAIPADHIGPANLLRVRVSYKPNGPVAIFPWQARLDESTWRFTP